MLKGPRDADSTRNRDLIQGIINYEFINNFIKFSFPFFSYKYTYEPCFVPADSSQPGAQVATLTPHPQQPADNLTPVY